MNQIELTKTEIDNLIIRENLFQQKQLELNIISNEALLLIDTFKKKYGVEGNWARNGNCLVKLPDQEIKNNES